MKKGNSMRKKKENKKIVFNDENTKLFNVNQNTSSTNNKFKQFLNYNKIYFETLLMFILTVAGIIVSIVGVRVGIVANNIAKTENQISDLEKQPTFVIENETNKSEEKYIIRNTGGDIQYGNLILDKVFLIYIYDENYDYLGRGYIIWGGYMDKGYSTYDFDTKSFSVSTKLTSRPITQWTKIISDTITEQGYFYGVICTEHLDITYQNYKQELITRDMIVENGIVRDFDRDNEYSFKIYANADALEDGRLPTDLREEIELLQRYNN